MATLEQRRALLAFEHIQEVKRHSPEEQKKYASMVHALPSLLRSAGLSQSLHFVASRSEKEQRLLLAHVAAQLGRIDAAIENSQALLGLTRSADLSLYLRLTHEALACATWYRRLVQGVLKIQAGESNGTS